LTFLRRSTYQMPPIAEQTALCEDYANALDQAAKLEQEAQAIEESGLRAFEDALGVAPSIALPDRPVFVARFKDIERWSHDGALRAEVQTKNTAPSVWPYKRLGDEVADLENGWSPKCHDYPAHEGKWGVLKVGSVSFGTFDENQNKELPEKLKTAHCVRSEERGCAYQQGKRCALCRRMCLC